MRNNIRAKELFEEAVKGFLSLYLSAFIFPSPLILPSSFGFSLAMVVRMKNKAQELPIDPQVYPSIYWLSTGLGDAHSNWCGKDWWERLLCVCLHLCVHISRLWARLQKMFSHFVRCTFLICHYIKTLWQHTWRMPYCERKCSFALKAPCAQHQYNFQINIGSLLIYLFQDGLTKLLSTGWNL